MQSLSTVSQANELQFDEILHKFAPDLYLIKIALSESGVNPLILPPIIRTIGNLSMGSGWGKIQIFMQARVITQVKPEESVSVNEEAVIDR